MSLPSNMRMMADLVASTTQTQAGALQLDVGTFGHSVGTVATAADAVKLPKAIAGKIVAVNNADSADSMGVFPGPGDSVNALAADAVYAVAANKTVLFICFKDGVWKTILTA